MLDPKQPGRKLRRIVKLAQVLIGLQKYVLAQIERVLAMRHQPQQIIEDTFLPARDQDVVGVHIPAPRFCDQVAVLNLPKYQISAPFPQTPPRAKKSKGLFYSVICESCTRIKQ